MITNARSTNEAKIKFLNESSSNTQEMNKIKQLETRCPKSDSDTQVDEAGR